MHSHFTRGLGAIVPEAKEMYKKLKAFPFLHQILHTRPVILFHHFYRLIWESFPIQKWPLFSQYHVF